MSSDALESDHRGIALPEAPEVDTDCLHEQIEEEVEHDGGASLKAIALTTALFGYQRP
jgi:hypothetical protein